MRAWHLPLLLAILAAAAGHGAEMVFTVGDREGSIHRLLGVNIGPLPAGEPGNADLTAAYHATGITQIRTHDYYGPLDMATLYPDQSADPTRPESYDFAASDRVFRAIVDGGFEPYLRIGDSWNNQPGFPKAEPRRPTHYENFVRAAVEVVRHYTDERLWAPSKVRCVEFWNEPDGRFWDAPQADFNRLYVQGAKALKAAFPHLQIGGPGYTPGGALTERGRQVVAAFVRTCREQQAPLDFLSWHLYSNQPADYDRCARFYREVLDAHGFQATVLHVTEYHTSHRDLSRAEQLEVRAKARGAAILTAGWIILQRRDIREAMVYRGPDPAMNAPEFYGLFFADARPKKTGLAVRLWADLCGFPHRLRLSGISNALYALAAGNEAGEVAVLLANPTNQSVAWRLAGLTGTALRLREVTDAADGLPERALTSPAATAGPYTVQLLTGARR